MTKKCKVCGRYSDPQLASVEKLLLEGFSPPPSRATKEEQTAWIDDMMQTTRDLRDVLLRTVAIEVAGRAKAVEAPDTEHMCMVKQIRDLRAVLESLVKLYVCESHSDVSINPVIVARCTTKSSAYRQRSPVWQAWDEARRLLAEDTPTI